MKFRPCIDLHQGRVKQIVGKSLSDTGEPITNFVSSYPPSWYATLYKSDNLYGGHIIMLGKGNESAALDALTVFPGGMQIGGGITVENARFYLDKGASHIIVTSYVFSDGLINWDNLKKLNNSIGKNRVVLDISCKKRDGKYYIVTDRWQKFTDVALDKESIRLLEDYCDEFLVHAVDVEGAMKGIDKELINILADNVDITVTYAGGITSLDELDEIRNIGKNKIDFTIGSALDIFGGTLSYKKVVEWHNNNLKHGMKNID